MYLFPEWDSLYAKERSKVVKTVVTMVKQWSNIENQKWSKVIKNRSKSGPNVAARALNVPFLPRKGPGFSFPAIQ